MKPTMTPALNSEYGADLNAEGMDSVRGGLGGSLVRMTVIATPSRTNVMKARTLVAQPKPLRGCSCLKTIG